jgi:hypothetical protein
MFKGASHPIDLSTGRAELGSLAAPIPNRSHGFLNDSTRIGLGQSIVFSRLQYDLERSRIVVLVDQGREAGRLYVRRNRVEIIGG